MVCSVRNEAPTAIQDYALIGDCKTAALVSRRGSIDWLCLPRFDSPACFAALLGSPENGRWLLQPLGKARSTRRYRPHTLVLETKFEDSDGQVTLIDYMSMNAASPRIVRIVRGDRGVVAMRMDLVIRFDYGMTVPWVTRQSDGSLLAIASSHRLMLRAPVPVEGRNLHTAGEFSVKAGQTLQFELQYGSSFQPAHFRPSSKSALRKTEQSWRKWAARGKYRGRWADAVERSLITLKALTYSQTGGIVASATTSLPEQPGGGQNWDYRYCWIRDATFTLLAFTHAGYHQEARQWKSWLMRSAAGSADQLQVVYGVAGERLLREWEVPWLSGYHRASPVRVGNAACEQLQLDIYGELADALYHTRTLIKKDSSHFDLQIALIEHLERVWRQPDHGIWEVRGRERHFTHSKVMAWVALDRTIRSAQHLKIDAPLDKWRAVRREIHEDVCRFGFNSGLGYFTQAYGSNEVDASLLLLPLVGFLSPEDPRIVATVKRIEQKLLQKGFVMRHQGGASSGKSEGAFLPASFWLADYYGLVGRRADSRALLRRLLRVRNDVGLLSEEYDVGTRSLVGNFPQAWSHVALVNTIVNLHNSPGPAHVRSGSKGGIEALL